MDKQTRQRLYYHLGLLFLAAGVCVLLTALWPAAGLEPLAGSLTLLGGGLIILALMTVKSGEVQDRLVLLAILLSIPLITLFLAPALGFAIWAFPLILMVAALVFPTPLPLILITGAAILSQFALLLVNPGQAAAGGPLDLPMRIGIFGAVFWIGALVNNFFSGRLQENIRQKGIQELISTISSDFVSINQANIKEKINGLLRKTGQFAQVDQACVVLLNKDKTVLTCTHKWYRDGNKGNSGLAGKISCDAFPWLMGQLREDQAVCIEDVQKLPEQASAEKIYLLRKNLKSAVLVPIFLRDGKGGLRGFIGFYYGTAPGWSRAHPDLFRILANLLADGLLRVEAEKEIEYMAYYDPLTGLPNRLLFADRLGQAINLSRRTEKFIGVVFMDLDGFKIVNDTLGHSGGDMVLKEIGKILEGNLRDTDTVARFTGDEFLILLNNIDDPEDIVTIADKIGGLFKNPFVFEGREVFVTASAGIAVFPADGEDGETLIKNADIAMSRAKANGKNQYALCTKDMKDEIKRNMILANNLFRAQERGELIVYYQPQINLETGSIIGFEALLRWNHPEMGMISPNVFIPLAEKSGLINRIGEFVLKTASAQNKAWQERGHKNLRMSVNLSMIQFGDPRLVSTVGAVLEEASLNPRYLELEITENVAIKEPTHTLGVLNRLKDLGVTIAIDDFGTKYSSLSRLKALPIDRIKIDMQFVQGIENSEKDRAITEVIINLAKSLGLAVLAEGVETGPQLDFLNQRLCDDVQGFYYYKPMPAHEIEILLNLDAMGS